MKLPALFCSLVLGACVVGDGEVDVGDESSDVIASSNPGDRLRWSSLRSSCAHGDGMVANGAELSVLFDQGTQWRSCTFNATLRVPASVRLTGLMQFVRTEGASANLRYAAKVNGNEVTTKRTNVRGTLEANASIASLGDVLCRQPGGGDRYIQVSFSAGVEGTGVALDSVDWAFTATNCR